MNTDNMAVSGETIDFGPCAFLDAYDPAAVFSAIDEGGRYAYANQPRIAHWNLARLAESLLPLLAENEDAAIADARAALAGFGPAFTAAYQSGLARKLGVDDAELAEDLLGRMAANGADFTLTFRHLCDAAETADADAAVRALFADPSAYDDWAAEWRRRLADNPAAPGERRSAMRAANPAVIPRNHLIEEIITAAVRSDDYAPFEALHAVLQHPYDDQPHAYSAPPRPEQRVLQTYCGT
jgi:uncharacterized protein YdiU (UPF0061 family)